jgi:hypothetical protein
MVGLIIIVCINIFIIRENLDVIKEIYENIKNYKDYI